MVKVEAIGATRAAADIERARRKMPFVIQKTINGVLQAVQRHVLTQTLPSEFTTRSKGAPWQKPGQKFGFNIGFAKWQELSRGGTIGTQADWMRLQETGGVKTVGSAKVAIPTPFWFAREELRKREKKPRALMRLMKAPAASRVKRLERMSTELQRRGEGARAYEAGLRHGAGIYANMPRAERRRRAAEARKAAKGWERAAAKAYRDLSKARTRRAKASVALNAAAGSISNRPFVAHLKSGASGIFVRTSASRLPIQALFWFERQASIKPRLGLIEEGTRIVRETYQQEFARRFAEEMAGVRT